MNEAQKVRDEIFYSCTEKEFLVKEHFIPVHVLTYVYAGKLQVQEASGTYVLEQGNTGVFSRNYLAKVTKIPVDGAPFKSVSIALTQEFLQQYFLENPRPSIITQADRIKILKPHFLLDSLFTSILPYYEMEGKLPKALIDLKLKEAITILQNIDPGIYSLLSDFAEPGKIDLAEFMQKNFAFNISLEKFAYLTGRSLATFKRDFQKTFQSSPQKWLQQKRLEQAHYLMAERKKKPSETYLEVGFENFSHFSYAFKQLFGYNPSTLGMSVPAHNF